MKYHSVDSNLIEVQVLNESTDIFSYPQFVLYDAAGDTLAKESWGFFGIGSFVQSHFLSVQPGVILPEGTFMGTLELFTNFTTSTCIKTMSMDLCPGACVQAHIYLSNSGALLNLPVDWLVYDSSNTVVASGQIMMNTSTSTYYDSLCLAPGSYEIVLVAFTQFTSAYTLGITHDLHLSSGTNTNLQSDPTPVDMNFDWYAACAGVSTGIEESVQEDLNFSVIGDQLFLSLDMGDLGLVQLLDSKGQLILSEQVNASQNTLNLAGTPAGIYIVRSVDGSKVRSAKMLLAH